MGQIFPLVSLEEGHREVVLIPLPIADINPPSSEWRDRTVLGGRAPAYPLPTPTLHSTYSDQRWGECWGLKDVCNKGQSSPFTVNWARRGSLG